MSVLTTPQDIMGALTQAYQAVGLSLPTSYPLRDFSPPASGPWAGVNILDAGRVTDTLGAGGMDQWDGIYQVDVHVPENDGTANLNGYIGQLLEYFKAGTRFTYNGQQVLVRRSSPSSVRKDAGASYVKSVSIYWSAWTSR